MHRNYGESISPFEKPSLSSVIMMVILIPLRNPTDVLIRTIDSILQQDRDGFSILLSDNHSISGQAFIEDSWQKLTRAGLDARLVRPPMELRRVEHWNWLHFQTQAAWLKPLFAGDWLAPDYIATVRQEIERNPQCSYIYGRFIHHSGTEKSAREVDAWKTRYYPPAEMRQKVLRFGMQFGPPCMAAYRREAFLAMGGYRITLPIWADSLLFCTLAARFGGVEITRSTSNSYPQESIGQQRRQAGAFYEMIIFLVALIYHAFTENAPLSRWGILRRAVLEISRGLRAKLGFSTP